LASFQICQLRIGVGSGIAVWYWTPVGECSAQNSPPGP